MIIIVSNHPYRYDMENISTIFFPYEKIKIFENSCAESDAVTVSTEINGNILTVDAVVYDKHKKKSLNADKTTDKKSALSILLYDVLSEILEITYPWGLL